MPNIIVCSTWGARQPNGTLKLCAKAKRIIFHHTAGHHQDFGSPGIQTYAESVKYARAVQNYHMDTQGWTDSGHHFMVMRNGLIFQGRWKTVSQIQAKRCVVGAHCPGQNMNIGIEHEHLGVEEMTKSQRESSAWLMAWVAEKYDLDVVLPVEPHSKYYATACPANLTEDIPGIRARAQMILDGKRT